MENILLEELNGGNSTVVQLLVENHEVTTDTCNQYIHIDSREQDDNQQIAIEVDGQDGVKYLYVLGSNVCNTSMNINQTDKPSASNIDKGTSVKTNEKENVNVASCGTMTDILDYDSEDDMSKGTNIKNGAVCSKVQCIHKKKPIQSSNNEQWKHNVTCTSLTSEVVSVSNDRELVNQDNQENNNNSITEHESKNYEEHQEGEITIMNEMKIVPVSKQVSTETDTCTPPNSPSITVNSATRVKLFESKNKSIKPNDFIDQNDNHMTEGVDSHSCDKTVEFKKGMPNLGMETDEELEVYHANKTLPSYERPCTRSYRQVPVMDSEKVSNSHVCLICDKEFDSEKRLKSHMKCHDKAEPHVCEICGKTFRMKETFDNHCYTHRVDEDKPFKCDVCGISFIKKHYLQRHSTCHTGVKPFRCDECGSKFRTKGDLRRHERLHGEKPGVKQYKCKLCGKRYCAESGLLRHLRAHKGEKPYECDLCLKAFSMPGDLKRHIKTHFGGDDFPCKICGKVLSSAVGFKRHQRMHSGEKPYECSQCGNCYIDLWSLTKHKKLHEKGKDGIQN